MKKTYKLLSVILTVIVLISICTNFVNADVDVSNLANSGTLNQDTENSMLKVGGTIFNFITNAAMILAVVILAVLGIKYMMGSTEEKAEYKKSLLPYVIGSVLVFGAAAIGKMVITFGQSIV